MVKNEVNRLLLNPRGWVGRIDDPSPKKGWYKGEGEKKKEKVEEAYHKCSTVEVQHQLREFSVNSRRNDATLQE